MTLQRGDHVHGEMKVEEVPGGTWVRSSARALSWAAVSKPMPKAPALHVVSSNPGCMLQIASGLADAGRPVRTIHLIELLDASIREHA